MTRIHILGSRQEPHCRRRLPSWALALALGLLFASQASALTTGQIEWLNFPEIHVASNGDEYTGVPALASGWEARFIIEAGVVGRVKSWQLRPELQHAGVQDLDFALYKASKSYSWNNRPKKVHLTVGEIFPSSFVQSFATEACNDNLASMMNQGHSRHTVLSQNRTIVVTVLGHLDFDVTAGDTIIEAFWKDTEIVCDKSPFEPIDPGPNTIESGAEFRVESANLIVFPGYYSGSCPKDLTLFMEVQGTLKGTFEARVEAASGWKSTAFVLKTNEFDSNSNLWSREFNHALTVPVKLPTGGGGGGGGGAGAHTASNDLQVLPPPGDDPFPGGQGGAGQHAVGGVTAQDPGSNVHKESFRLVAKGGGQTVYSDWDQSTVICDPNVAIEPVTNALLPGGSGPGPKPGDGDPAPSSGDAPKPDAPAPSAPAPQAQTARLKGRGEPSKAQIGTAKGGDEAKGRETKGRESKGREPKGRETKKNKPAAENLSAAAGKSSTPSRSQGKPSVRGGKASAQQADLRVVNARRSAKNPMIVEFRVENAGQANAAASRAVLTCAGEGGHAETRTEHVPAIPGGGRRWVESRPAGARRTNARVRGCEIRIDSNDDVAESNERNNVFSCPECAPVAKRKGR